MRKWEEEGGGRREKEGEGGKEKNRWKGRRREANR